MKIDNFFAELKRRNVYKVAIAYVVGGWALSQGIAQVFPVFDVPNGIIRLLVLLIILGLPVSLVLAWMFELTPEGIKRTEDVDLAPQPFGKSHAWIYIVVVGLIVSIALFFVGRYTGQSETKASIDRTPGKSVAVLPFVNMSAEKNDEYLSDGMTEELISVLAKVPGLRVPGRTSSFAFKGKNEEDIFRRVAEQLHVGTVLEGSVRKAGDTLRVTAQLINAKDGYHIWSKDYDGDVKDVLNFESNVAEQVVQALQVKLGIDETRALAKKPTENPEAHRLYLLGRYYTAKYTEADVAKAVLYYKQALELDPDFALAYCGLADNYGLKSGNAMPGREALPKEKALAQKALELDPDLAEAHLSLGVAFAGSYNWAAAEQELNRALTLNPNLSLAYDASAWVYAVSGRFDEAIATEKKGLALDPLNPFMNLGWWLYWAGKNDEAINQLRSSMELHQEDAFSHMVLGWCLIKNGNAAEGIAELEKATKLDDLPWYRGWLGYAYAVSGNRGAADQILRDLEELAKTRYVSPGARVPVYLGLQDKEKILDWLAKCYDDEDGACWWLKIDRRYGSLRSEPRFQALVKKVGLSQ